LLEKFKGHRNVRCLVLDDKEMDFTAFNDNVLSGPVAIKPAMASGLTSAEDAAEGSV
jgi:hypothetical protein